MVFIPQEPCSWVYKSNYVCFQNKSHFWILNRASGRLGRLGQFRMNGAWPINAPIGDKTKGIAHRNGSPLARSWGVMRAPARYWCFYAAGAVETQDQLWLIHHVPYDSVNGLRILLDHIRDLGAHELSSPEDEVVNYESIFTEDDARLKEFTNINFAIQDKKLIHLLFARMPSLKHLIAGLETQLHWFISSRSLLDCCPRTDSAPLESASTVSGFW